MKKYLEELEIELQKRNFKSSDIKEIIQDHTEMIQEALDAGLSEEDIDSKFGNPAKVAASLLEDNVLDTEESEPQMNYQSSKDYVLYKSFNVSTDKISMEISLTNEDYSVEASDSEYLEVYYKGKGDLSHFEIDLSESSFVLKQKKNTMFRSFFSSNHDGLDFLVKVPSVMIENGKFSTVNADGKIKDVKGNKVTINSTNGDFSVESIHLDSISFNGVNGDIELNKIIANELKVSVVNGDVTLRNSGISNEIYLNSVSGDMKVENSYCKSCDYKTVSGDLKGKEFYPEELSLDSMSGDITIQNSDSTKRAMIIKQKSLSGSIRIS